MALAKSTICSVITKLLLQAGIDGTGFTSKSMRKGAACGGLSRLPKIGPIVDFVHATGVPRI